jgi:hypothetical protein
MLCCLLLLLLLILLLILLLAIGNGILRRVSRTRWLPWIIRKGGMSLG